MPNRPTSLSMTCRCCPFLLDTMCPSAFSVLRSSAFLELYIKHSEGLGRNFLVHVARLLPSAFLQLLRESHDTLHDPACRSIIKCMPNSGACGAQVEDKTPFAKKYTIDVKPLPSTDSSADMYRAASSVLRSAGYEHYEVSNYARPGHRYLVTPSRVSYPYAVTCLSALLPLLLSSWIHTWLSKHFKQGCHAHDKSGLHM